MRSKIGQESGTNSKFYLIPYVALTKLTHCNIVNSVTILCSSLQNASSSGSLTMNVLSQVLQGKSWAMS